MLNAPLLDPEHIELPPVVEPFTVRGATTTTNESLLTFAQLPLPITALKAVLAVNVPLV